MSSPLRVGTVVGVLLLAAAAGLLLSLYGPALPELRAAFGVGGAGAALALSAHFAGAIAGITCWGLVQRRLPPGPCWGRPPPCWPPARSASPSPRPGRWCWRPPSASAPASG